jgi:hypothetical protein
MAASTSRSERGAPSKLLWQAFPHPRSRWTLRTLVVIGISEADGLIVECCQQAAGLTGRLRQRFRHEHRAQEAVVGAKQTLNGEEKNVVCTSRVCRPQRG